jgi:hypothetical protein
MVLLFPGHDSVLDEVKIAAKIEAWVEIHGTQDGANTCTDGFDKSIYRECVTQKWGRSVKYCSTTVALLPVDIVWLIERKRWNKEKKGKKLTQSAFISPR